MVLSMDAHFSKFQAVLRFALQILLADNFKGFKTQPVTKKWNHSHRNKRNGTTMCSLTNPALEFQVSPWSK